MDNTKDPVRVLREALTEVVGCFEAAQVEGLEDALLCSTDAHLRDLVERRLMYALRAAQPFVPRVFRDGDAVFAVWPDFIDLQASPAGFGDTKQQAIEQLLQVTYPAAIPHSEQRETVAAGEVPFGYAVLSDRRRDGWTLFKGGTEDQAARMRQVYGTVAMLYTAPVAAPVPEAKALDDRYRQGYSDGWREGREAPACSICNDGGVYCVGTSGQESDGNAPILERCECDAGLPSAAPAVKHEASELVPLIVKVERNRVWIARGVQSFMLAYEADADEELNLYADQLRTVIAGFTPDVKNALSQSAPPIAVQGSGDDEHLRGLFGDMHPLSVECVLSYIKENCIDSRSRIAAAPSQLQEAQAECWKRGARISELEVMLTSARDAALEEAAKVCEETALLFDIEMLRTTTKLGVSGHTARMLADAIRALSAAAPSADAKADQ